MICRFVRTSSKISEGGKAKGEGSGEATPGVQRISSPGGNCGGPSVSLVARVLRLGFSWVSSGDSGASEGGDGSGSTGTGTPVDDANRVKIRAQAPALGRKCFLGNRPGA